VKEAVVKGNAEHFALTLSFFLHLTTTALMREGLFPIEIRCPRCHEAMIVRNGKNAMRRKIISSGIAALVKIMAVRGAGIQDTAASIKISS
jgi:hypothetical protein